MTLKELAASLDETDEILNFNADAFEQAEKELRERLDKIDKYLAGKRPELGDLAMRIFSLECANANVGAQWQRLGALEASLGGVLEQGAKADEALAVAAALDTEIATGKRVVSDNAQRSNVDRQRIARLEESVESLLNIAEIDGLLNELLEERIALLEREIELANEQASTFWSRLYWLLTGY